MYCPAQLSWLEFTALYRPLRCGTLSLLWWYKLKWRVPLFSLSLKHCLTSLFSPFLLFFFILFLLFFFILYQQYIFSLFSVNLDSYSSLSYFSSFFTLFLSFSAPLSPIRKYFSPFPSDYTPPTPLPLYASLLTSRENMT